MWNVAVGDPAAGYAITHAPLVVKDKVIVGVAGGEYGIRGFIAAYRRQDRQGSLALLHHSRPGEPGNETWERRFVEARRRFRLGHRLLRSATQPDLLGHRKSGAGLERRHRAKATTSTAIPWWRWTPTRAS